MALPASLRTATVAAAAVGVLALVLLGTAAARGRWSTVAWTAVIVVASFAFVRGVTRRRRAAWVAGLGVASIMTAFFALLLVVKLVLLPAQERGDPLEVVAIAGVAAPFAAIALALVRRSARAWFRPVA
jgi:hypothetical protein